MSEMLTVESELRRKSPELFSLYEKLKGWAASWWTDHNDVHEQIRHDVSHSDALMEYANILLQHKFKDDILNEKELFLFASSVCLHDIGMQTGWKEALGIQGDRGNLTAEERKRIRANHAQTSGAVIRSFKSDVPASLKQQLNEIQLNNLTIDLNERLAFIVESHNAKDIAEYLKVIPTNFPQNTLKIDFVSALLQFCDVMHMDNSRLNVPRFLDEVEKWKEGKILESSYEDRDWQRFFQSYYVESVYLEPVNAENVFEIKVNVKFNPREVEDNINRFLGIYSSRLQRRKNDCLEIFKKYDIRFVGDWPFCILEPESSKITIPEKIASLLTNNLAQHQKNIASSAIGTKKASHIQNKPDFVGQYCSWLCETTSTYLIPGIRNTSFPVSKCWLPLSAIELPISTQPPQSPREAL